MENLKTVYSKEQKPTSIILTSEQKQTINTITRNIDVVADDVLDQVITNNDVVKTLENGHPLNRLITNESGEVTGYVACEDFIPTEAYIKYLGTTGSTGKNLLKELPAFFEYAKSRGYIKLNFHGWNNRLNAVLQRYGFERIRSDSLGEFSADFYEKVLQLQKTDEQIQQERTKAFEEKFIVKVQQEYQKTLQTFGLESSVIQQQIESLTGTIIDRTKSAQLQLSEKNIAVLKLKLARHFQKTSEFDMNVFTDALMETPKFLESDKGHITRLFEIHEEKTLQKIADQRYVRAYQVKFANILNESENINPDFVITDIVEQFNPNTIRESFVYLDNFYFNPDFTNEQKNATLRTIEQKYNIDVFSRFNPYEALCTTSSGNYYMARLLNMPHLKQESDYMNHCVGTSDSYVSKINRGEIEILSFRKTPTINKEQNKLNQDDTPLLTIEYNLKTKVIQQMKKYDDKYLQTNDPYYHDVIEALGLIRETTTDTGEKRNFRSINPTELQNITVPDYSILTAKGVMNITDYDPADTENFILKKGLLDIDNSQLSHADIEKIIQLETGVPIQYSEIAFGIEQINSETKLYIGPWSPDIMHHIPDTVEHLYESFPDKKILKKTIELTSKTPEQYRKELIDTGNQISTYAEEILNKIEPLQTPEPINLVSFSVEQLGFPNGATYAKIKEKAESLGLKLCPPQVGPELRLQYTDQPNSEYLRIAMDVILDLDGDPSLFSVYRYDGGYTWLYDNFGRDDFRWDGSHGFVFSKD